MSKRMKRLFLVYFSLCVGLGFALPAEAGLGKLWPFASKKHIKKQVDPLTGRVSELEEIGKRQDAEIKAMDERAQTGIRMAMNKTDEADTKAMEADRKAVGAQEMAKLADSNVGEVENRLQSRLEGIENYQFVRVVAVNFKLNQSTLDPSYEAALDGLASELKDSKGYLLEIVGFADPSGSAKLNIELSRQRASSVVRYLAERHEIPLFRMRTLGMGDANRVENQDGRVNKKDSRRVEVRLLRNDSTEVASK